MDLYTNTDKDICIIIAKNLSIILIKHIRKVILSFKRPLFINSSCETKLVIKENAAIILSAPP